MNSSRPISTCLTTLLVAAGLFLPGCAKRTPNAAADAAPHKHEHHPPHGGTPVVLGDEQFHVELVRDPAVGSLQAYVLDDEMEEFVRIAAASLVLDVQVGGKPQHVILLPVADSATGETLGNTSLFAGQADWLKTEGNFDATLEPLSIHGTPFGPTPFNFPSGNDRN